MHNSVRLALLAAFSITIPFAAQAQAPDVVRLGNLKFAHYGAVSYMKEACGKYNLKVEELMFPKGPDIMPAIVAGNIDIAALASDGAISGRANGVPIYAVAGFAKGGARVVAGIDSGIKTLADMKGKKVGVTRGGAHELLLYAELEKAGLTKDEAKAKAGEFGAALKGALTSAGYPEKADTDRINKPMTIFLLWILVIYVTMVYGPIAAYLVELFPTQIRYTSMSLPYHIGNGWFGGFLPAISFALVAATGNLYYGLWYPIGIAVMTLIIGTFFLRETKDVDITK